MHRIKYALLFILITSKALAHEPSIPFYEYLMSLKQPDHPGISCCGPSDQVYVDKYEMQTNGGFAVWLQDRTDILVPPEKVIWDQINPTGRGVLFFKFPEYGVSGDNKGYFVYCFHPGSGA